MTVPNTDKIVVFTGHRDVSVGHVELIHSNISDICATADEFVVGGADGADAIALLAICDLASAGKRFPRVTVVVANTISSQPSDARAAISRAIIEIGAEVIEMKEGYTAYALKKRNRVMVDRAAGQGTLLAYWRGIYKSGTYSTICYAKSAGLIIRQIIE